MSGEIRRIGKNPTPTRTEPKVLGQNEIRTEPQVLDKNSRVEQAPGEVVVHEETIVDGQDKIRRPRTEIDAPEIRFRDAKDRAAWERVKRGEDY